MDVSLEAMTYNTMYKNSPAFFSLWNIVEIGIEICTWWGMCWTSDTRQSVCISFYNLVLLTFSNLRNRTYWFIASVCCCMWQCGCWCTYTMAHTEAEGQHSGVSCSLPPWDLGIKFRPSGSRPFTPWATSQPVEHCFIRHSKLLASPSFIYLLWRFQW